ncbi:Uncharacterized protein TCM_033831 isoform 2 [Theobroma cacao]|uniref:Uncharacterized protein isoform 2 n=1 Tax=Theobroma cacao TaxID=3641 RepID=A0A061FCJ1_THECC|nr:Uncharacterized protein TCM_033831 isoform 2 [Theobroma cacao]
MLHVAKATGTFLFTVNQCCIFTKAASVWFLRDEESAIIFFFLFHAQVQSKCECLVIKKQQSVYCNFGHVILIFGHLLNIS